ncbi:MAG: branched-chain amino acid ABC transporter permease [Halanaeroarchaeum sp.]
MNDLASAFARGRDLVAGKPLAIVLWVGMGLLLFDLFTDLLDGSLQVSQLAAYVLNGLTVGLVIGLAGVGLSMTYSILNFANFAHGDYITYGAFSGWAATFVVAGFGAFPLDALLLVGAGGSVYASELGISISTTPVAIVVGLFFAILGTIGLSLVVDRFVFKPLRDEEGIILLITSVGVALALRYGLVFVFQQNSRGLTVGSSKIVFPFVDGTVNVSYHQLTLIVVSVALMLGIHLLLQRTKLGKAMRAMADNRDLALITGIPTESVVRWTWIIGGGLTGAAGYLIILDRGTLSYNFGWLLLLLVFAAVILGGIGSIYGAIGGGLIIGLASKISLVWLPEATFARPAAFLVMILILIYKPQGLFSGRSTA